MRLQRVSLWPLSQLASKCPPAMPMTFLPQGLSVLCNWKWSILNTGVLDEIPTMKLAYPYQRHKKMSQEIVKNQLFVHCVSLTVWNTQNDFISDSECVGKSWQKMLLSTKKIISYSFQAPKKDFHFKQWQNPNLFVIQWKEDWVLCVKIPKFRRHVVPSWILYLC